MAGCRIENSRCFGGSVLGKLPHAAPAPGLPTGGNRITQAVLSAHDGGVFGLCALRDGTLVSGGGRDRRVVLWGSDYSKLQEVEVRMGRGSCEGEETPPHPARAPNAPASPLHVTSSPAPASVPYSPARLLCSRPPRSLRILAQCALWQRAEETRCM